MRHLGLVFLFALIILWLAKGAFAQQIVMGFVGGKSGAYSLGIDLIRRGAYREARAVLEDALRMYRTDPVLHEMLGDVCANLGDSDRALDAYTEAIQLGSRHYSIYAYRGALHSLREDWVPAIADFDKAIQIDPKRPDCYYNRGMAYRGIGQYAKARTDLERAYKRGGEKLAASALANLLATCPDGAVRDSFEAIKYAKKNCEQVGYEEYASLSRLSAAFAEAGQWDEAVRWSEQALTLAKGGYRRLQRILVELYQHHHPYREFTSEWIAKHPPTTAGEALLYAIVKDNAGDRAGAIAELRKAIVWNPRLAEAHFLLGERILHEHTKEAAVHFSRCLELNPKHAEALAWRGTANLWLGKYREALTDAEAALRLDPEDLKAPSVRLWALASCGEVDRALQEVKKLHQRQITGAWRHAFQGRCYVVQGRFNDAACELTEALRQGSPDVLAYADRAVALSALGKEAAAKQDLEECVRLAPSLRTPTEARMKAAKKKTSHP